MSPLKLLWSNVWSRGSCVAQQRLSNINVHPLQIPPGDPGQLSHSTWRHEAVIAFVLPLQGHFHNLLGQSRHVGLGASCFHPGQKDGFLLLLAATGVGLHQTLLCFRICSNFREKFRVFPRTIWEKFSGVDTQTAVLVSTAEDWMPAPDTQTPISLGFLGIHSWLWFFCRETKSFGYFPEVPVTKIRVSAPAPCKNSRARRPWSANRDLRGWRRRGCREGCQEHPEKGAYTVN